MNNLLPPLNPRYSPRNPRRPKPSAKWSSSPIGRKPYRSFTRSLPVQYAGDRPTSQLNAYLLAASAWCWRYTGRNLAKRAQPAVFAYLLDHHTHPVTREALIEAFWPDIRLIRPVTA